MYTGRAFVAILSKETFLIDKLKIVCYNEGGIESMSQAVGYGTPPVEWELFPK